MAYPFGIWSQEALAHVAAAGYRAAFQLSDPQDTAQPPPSGGAGYSVGSPAAGMGEGRHSEQ